MTHFMLQAGALVFFGVAALSFGWSQGTPPAQQAPAQTGQAQGEAPAAQPAATKEELDAYNKFVADAKTASDARQMVNLGETFLATYPNSIFAGAVHGQLAIAYLNINQVDKMIDSGEKALAADPNNVDVLPLMAWAIPRRVNSSTPNPVQQLEKAMNYARRAINLLSTMPKPVEMDDAAFAKVKNDKLAQCRSGMGTAYFKTGKFDEAVNELNQAVRLDSNPDPVDYYVLGVSNDRASHFTDAVMAFDKCAASPGQLQAQCRNLSAETKRKAANSLEAPR
jgi:tetratricopeptide (TPR) repeat protein